ncbi:hypothetical protein FALB51S_00448 [Frigidibacter albus]|uniref:Uncharacterized protein n=1 Tax=Frigidibacter mobilis TaxID=1335048 RepID=A0A161H270_9RHOB|nr:hypothetical protein AKL17_3941 [Frigidibacter mobilis]
MTKLTETQSLILSAGAKRAGNIALPLPKGLAGAAAKMVVTRMIDQGLLHEVDADPCRSDPLLRETGDGAARCWWSPRPGCWSWGSSR